MSTLFYNRVDKGWSQKVQRSSLDCNHAYNIAATSESKYHKVRCPIVLHPMTSQTRYMEEKVQLHTSHLPKDKKYIQFDISNWEDMIILSQDSELEVWVHCKVTTSKCPLSSWLSVKMCCSSLLNIKGAYDKKPHPQIEKQNSSSLMKRNQETTTLHNLLIRE